MRRHSFPTRRSSDLLEMQLASTYETYLGKEFMNLDKLEKLIKVMETKDGMVVSEALKLYKEQVINS